jgi:signal transduction histidine kinase
LFKVKEGENSHHRNILKYFEDYNLSLTPRLGKRGRFSKGLASGGEEYSTKSSVEAKMTEILKENKRLGEEIASLRLAQETLYKAGKEKEKQIHSMIFLRTVSEERTRRRLSSYLHDNICQSLGIAKMKLDSLVKSISPLSHRAPLEEVSQIIQSTIMDVRAVIGELSPAVLHELGFEAGLDWLCEQFQEQNSIPCTFENDRFPKPLKEEVGILLFNLVRDLLMNVAEHAQAGSVKIRTLRKEDQLYIIVEDDGVGFTPLDRRFQPDTENGLGLFCVQELMSSIGGSMELMSAKGKGTHITLVAPLQPSKENRGEDL